MATVHHALGLTWEAVEGTARWRWTASGPWLGQMPAADWPRWLAEVTQGVSHARARTDERVAMRQA